MTPKPQVDGRRRPKPLGRRLERSAIDDLLDAAAKGSGGVLVLRGEPGIGKTSLLDYAGERAEGFQICRGSGFEAGMALPFATLQQFCEPLMDSIESLPAPQGEALAIAVGQRKGQVASRLLLGLAVLNLLTHAARARPLLGLIDDAHWLDGGSAQALAFVARRLGGGRVALVFTTEGSDDATAGLPGTDVSPLTAGDARAVLDSAMPARFDERVMRRMIAEAGGNPRELLRLAHGITPTQLAGGFGLPVAVPAFARIEASLLARVEKLAPEERRLLLVAAADPSGDPALMWRAARGLGIPEAAGKAVEDAGLLSLRDGVTFRHQLIRPAVYGAASSGERGEVHAALAAATDADHDPDSRAWHQAQATTGPDEEVAAELERFAARARARGGASAASAFLERAALLSLDPARRASRALAAARAQQQVGALGEALGLLADAEAGPLSRAQRAEAEVMRARIAFDAERGKEPPELLLAAARRLEAIDPPLAREVYLDAMSAAFFAARLGGGGDPRAIARAAREAPSSDAPPRPCDHLLDGLVLLILDGPAAATGRLREALDAFREEEPGSEEGLRWFWLAGRVAGYIWDYETWALLTARQIRAAREVGALSYLPLALSSQVGVHMFAGEVRAATAVLEEGNVLSDATAGHVHLPYGHQGMAAFSGREADLVRMLGSARDGYFVRGEGLGLTASHWMTALLYNGLGRYEDAFAAAGQATIDSREIWFSTLAAVELIEAAVRTDHDESARTAFAVLSESTRASATPWALGVEARCQALLSRGDEARSLYREAIERLKPTRLRVDLARTHLVHGEWLRRERRRVDARTELRTAHELFTEFGMNAFAERARLELEATGERARKRHAGTIDELTPREAQIARLAAEGETNREIAAQLFISLSTVEYHLRKVFRKLGVRSRTQLSHRLSQDR